MALIEVVREDGLAVVTLNRPPVNAIDRDFTEAARSAFEALDADPPKGIVVTGAGAVFSAGFDLKTVPMLDAAGKRALVLSANRMVRLLYGFPRPTVAAINGHCMAGGLCLALACDLRIAAGGPAKIALSEVNVGIPYPLGPLLVVQQQVAGPVQRDLVLLGKVYDPATALAAGLIDEVVPAAALLARAKERALAAAALPGFGPIKRQFRAGVLAELDRHIAAGDDPVFEHWR